MSLTVHGLKGLLARILQGRLAQFVIVAHVVLQLFKALAVHALGHTQGGNANKPRQQGKGGRAQKIGGLWLPHKTERQHKIRIKPDQKFFHKLSSSVIRAGGAVQHRRTGVLMVAAKSKHCIPLGMPGRCSACSYF